ncbi:hypothetical protein BC831DRAFT_482896 [Entophlyctis helioformis]|nr:hypothetical protein BC831DRAFT_482896 [Entophlyctis helioformis]
MDDAVLSFVEITGSDPDTAQRYLTLTGGDAEAAISLFLENGGADLADQDTALSRATAANAAAQASAALVGDGSVSSPIRDFDNDDNDVGGGGGGRGYGASRAAAYDSGVRAPIPARREILVGGDDDEDDIDSHDGVLPGPDTNSQYFSMYQEQHLQRLQQQQQQQQQQDDALMEDGSRNPFASGPSSSRGAGSGRGGLHLRGRAYHPGLASGGSSNDPVREPFRNVGQETRGNQDPSGSESRQDRLARLFRPPLDIMFTGNFDEARELARSQSKWLMVTIHDASEFACQAMNRDLWSDPTVKELIRENFVFVQFGLHSSEGERHKNFYPFESFPYIAVIDAMTGERVKVWRVKLDTSDFLIEVSDFFDRMASQAHQQAPMSYGSSSFSAEASAGQSAPASKKRLEEMSEEELMNIAIAQSMSENAAYGVMEQAAEAATGSAPSASAAPAAPAALDENDPGYPAYVFGTIASIAHPEPTTTAPALSTRIQFRFPDGQKVARKFNKADTVRAVFETIKGHYPQYEGKPFELYNMRQPLLRQLDSTIDDAKLGGSTLTLDLI